LLLPRPLKYIVDNVLIPDPKEPLPELLQAITGQDRMSMLIFFVVTGLIIVLLQQLVFVASSYVNTRIEQKITLDVRSQLFQHVQALSMGHHDQRKSGMLIYVINSCCDGVPRL